MDLDTAKPSAPNQAPQKQSVSRPPKPLPLNFRLPTAEDGPRVSQLIADCPPLDTNSRYCNLLQCSHFAATGVVVEHQGKLVGFVSGYQVPNRADTLFVWQVAVDQGMRGQRLAGRMLDHILSREPLDSVRFIETTITPGNTSSQAVFEKLAAQLEAPIERSVLFSKHTHFADAHEDEVLFRIGPFQSSPASS